MPLKHADLTLDPDDGHADVVVVESSAQGFPMIRARSPKYVSRRAVTYLVKGKTTTTKGSDRSAHFDSFARIDSVGRT